MSLLAAESARKLLKRREKSLKSSASAIAGLSVASNIGSGGGSGSLFQFMLMLSLIAYFRFFNVNYPGNITLMFEYVSAPAMSFPNFFKLLLKPDQETVILPARSAAHDKYNEYKVSVLFFESYGANASLLVSLLGFWLVTCFFSKILPRSKKPMLQKLGKAVMSVRGVIEWNMLITFVLAYLIRLVSAILLQLYNPTFKSRYEIASLIAAVLFLLFLILASSFLAFSQQKSATSTWTFIMSKCKVLVSDLEQDAGAKKPTPIFLILRNSCFVAAVVSLSCEPIAQATMALAICFIYTVILFRRPIYKSSRQNKAMRVAECLITLNTFIVLLYAVDDRVMMFSNTTRFSLGWVFIAIKLLLVLYLLIFQLVETGRVALAVAQKYLVAPMKNRLAAGKYTKWKTLTGKQTPELSMIGNQDITSTEIRSPSNILRSPIRELEDYTSHDISLEKSLNRFDMTVDLHMISGSRVSRRIRERAITPDLNKSSKGAVTDKDSDNFKTGARKGSELSSDSLCCNRPVAEKSDQSELKLLHLQPIPCTYDTFRANIRNNSAVDRRRELQAVLNGRVNTI